MNNSYKSLSKDELYLISRAEFESQKIITTAFVQRIFSDEKKASMVLYSLKKKGRILCIEKGKYLIVPIKAPNQRWAPNEYLTAALWMGEIPYYIGYSSAYNYWGFTEQIPQSISILNVQKSTTKKIGNVKYSLVKITEKKIYGIKKINFEGEEVKISDKERTLVDFIFNPVGSWGNVEIVVKEQLEEINIDKLIRYLIKFPVESVRKRAGVILENLDVAKNKLDFLKSSLTNKNTYVTFNPFEKSRKGKVNSAWKVIING